MSSGDKYNYNLETSGITCSSSPIPPDSRSELTSVLFVIEKSNTKFDLDTPPDFPGIQFVVTQCKDV